MYATMVSRVIMVVTVPMSMPRVEALVSSTMVLLMGEKLVLIIITQPLHLIYLIMLY